MNVFYAPTLETQAEWLLEEEESRHLKALRLQPGHWLELVNGRGGRYAAQLEGWDGKRARLTIRSAEQQRISYGIHLAVAPTKQLDRMEWMVEKCTEIGVDRISFVLTQNAERRHLKLDRLKRVAIAAMKQSLKAQIPQLDELTDLQPFLAQHQQGQRWVAHIQYGKTHAPILPNTAQPDQHHLMLIGPEGGFTEEEIRLTTAAGYQCVSLGQSRLRTETAALVACALLQK